MEYNVEFEIAGINLDENIKGTMVVEGKSEVRVREFVDQELENQYPGDEGYILLECQVTKRG